MRGNPEELYADLLSSDEDEREKQNRLYRTVGVNPNVGLSGPPAPEPKPSFIDRLLSGVYIPPAPLGPNQRDVGGRYFLHGLMQAIAANHGGGGALATGSRRTNGGGYGRASSGPAGVDPAIEAARIAEIQSRTDANKAGAEGMGGVYQARAHYYDRLGQPKPEKDDPLLPFKQRLIEAQIGHQNAMTANSRASGKRGAAGGNRAALSARFQAKVKEMTGRVAAIGAANGWSPEEIKAAQQRQVARLADEYSAMLTGDGQVEETPAFKDAGRPAAQRYTKPVAKGAKTPAAAGAKTKDQILKDLQ